MTDGSTGAPAGDLRQRRQGRAVSEDMRRHAVAAVLHEGMSRQAAARRFGVSASSVALWVRRYRERGDLRPDKRGGKASRIEPERGRILRILAARPNLTMYELRDALAAEGASFHPATVQRFLERHGLDLKSRRRPRPPPPPATRPIGPVARPLPPGGIDEAVHEAARRAVNDGALGV